MSILLINASKRKPTPFPSFQDRSDVGPRSLAFSPTQTMLERSSTQTLDSSPVRARSRRRGLRYTTVEQKIRTLHVAALDEDDLTEEQSRTLYSLELQASRHAGDSPRALLEKAKRILPNS
jgi:hypothetical protein